MGVKMRTKLRYALGSGGVLLICLFVVTGFLATRPSKTRVIEPGRGNVAFHFVGYTNDASGRRFATFTVTNQDSRAVVRFRPCRIEIRPRTGARPSLIEGQGFPNTPSLPPGSGETVSVPVPTVTGPWRALILCAPDGWRLRLSYLRRGSTGSLAWLRPIVPPVRPMYFASDWIEP